MEEPCLPYVVGDTHKPNKCHGGDHGRIVLCCAADDEPDEEKYISTNDEPSATKEVRVGTADPGLLLEWVMSRD